MKSLSTYIDNRIGLMKLSETQKEQLIEMDKEYGKLFFLYKKVCNRNSILNLDSECEKFLEARKRGVKYFPVLEPKINHDKLEDTLVPRLLELRPKFYKFPCFLSRYYIELISDMIGMANFLTNPKLYNPWFEKYNDDQRPSYKQFQAALATVKANPYQHVPAGERNIGSKEAQKEMQDYIDELGYDWEVKIVDDLVPRMSVKADGTMNVKADAKFSKDDLEGLKKHEIEGHIGRRHYGYKTKLFLFVGGLKGRNTLDEGLAVWNSLNKVEKPKPNIKFNTALKTVIAYYIDKKDFCELFDYCKSIAPNFPDNKLFSALIRFKRELGDCSLPGGLTDDSSYFCGYQMVNKMSDALRDDILKYNVGPKQIKDIPKIKKFLSINKL